MVQTGKIKVYRDNDKDNIAEVVATTESGFFGVNVHGSNRTGTTPKIGQWSAGCQVFNNWQNKEMLMNICEQFKVTRQNKFTYCLLEEKDLA